VLPVAVVGENRRRDHQACGGEEQFLKHGQPPC
jgi:hypothetical protein